LTAVLLTLGWFGLGGAEARSHHAWARHHHHGHHHHHHARTRGRHRHHHLAKVAKSSVKVKVAHPPKASKPAGPHWPCPEHCAAAVGSSFCHDHCGGSGDTTCQDHCYGPIDVQCHDHCYGEGDTYCHDHCYGPSDTYCHDHCYGPRDFYCHDHCYGEDTPQSPPAEPFEPAKPTPPLFPGPTPAPKTSGCHSNCTTAVDNSQCHDHCYGTGDSKCHDFCYGVEDYLCHNFCYGANDTHCHDHCYGAGAVKCHDNCSAPKPPPTPQPHIPSPVPSPGGGPSAQIPTGQPTVVRATIPSDSITGAITQPPGVVPQPGGPNGVGISGQGNGTHPPSNASGGGGTSRTPRTNPLAPGAASLGTATGTAGATGGTGGTGQSGGTGSAAGHANTSGGTTPHRGAASQPVIPVGAPTFPHVIEHDIAQVPWWVWLALAAALSLAATAGMAALRWGRSARARAGEVALVTADAMTDPLTGILNRRGFTTVAQRELERAQRYGHPLALAFVDVRGLKGVNDTRGHQAGDQLLKEVAALLRESSRSHDVVGRIGGDELAVMLTEQGADGMAAVMRRVRAQLPITRASLGFDHDWDLTIGMAVYPRDGHSVESLLAAADRRLYLQRGIEIR
jgi:diguanylate cyclase (GGDEF)-like protein